MSSNMKYRQFLTQNADAIIINNQALATGNCSDIITILNKNPLPPVPLLLRSITDHPHPNDNQSDIKDIYLQAYIDTAKTATPVIRY